MKKLSSISKALMMGVLLTFSLSSCSDDNGGGDDFSAKDSELSALTGRYVNDVIYVTYGELASQTERLYEQLDEAKSKFRANTLTQNDIDNICTTFLAARAAWEKSEAFLFGPATTFGIDPHIDTWPLNVTQLAKISLLKNPQTRQSGGIDCRWTTPNRCCSSMTASCKSLYITCFEKSACVPITMSISPFFKALRSCVRPEAFI